MNTDIQLYDPAVTAARTDLVRQVGTALAKLAAHGTRSQIADHLHDLGHLGHPGAGFSCPIARYLRGFVTDDDWVVVTRTHYHLDDVVAVPLPEPVAAFVRRFDAEDYPALISPESVPPPF